MSDLKGFRRFKWRFLSVYFLAQLCEYLQGPYMYALYSVHHRLPLENVGLLFFTSSLSNSISGCVLGPLADSQAKSRGCIAFCVCSIVSCIMTAYLVSFWCLVLARVLGGVATNLLETSFESYVVYEHHRRGFSHGLLEGILACASGGTGIVAVVAGLAAAVSVSQYDLRTPFVLGGTAGIVCLLFILAFWRGTEADSAQEETTGNNDQGDPTKSVLQMSTAYEAARNAVRLFASREDAQLCGLLQVGLEVPLDLFVFLWAQGTPKQIGEGLAFAGLMAGLATGSYLFRIGDALFGTSMFIPAHPFEGVLRATNRFGAGLHHLISISFFCGSFSLLWSISTACPAQRYIAYVFFELHDIGNQEVALYPQTDEQSSSQSSVRDIFVQVVVGLLLPALSSLRAQLLPDTCRATATNLPRVVFNVGLLGILGSEALRSPVRILAFSSLGMAVAGWCSARFGRTLLPKEESANWSLPKNT